MDYYLIALRLIHIVAGVVWAGTVVGFAIFVMPTVKALGPEGGKFMQHLVKLTGFSRIVAILGGVTVLAGFLLMWELSNGFQNGWMGSRYGIWLSTGALFGLIALIIGGAVSSPVSRKLQVMADTIEGSGGPPSEEQQIEIGRLQKKAISAMNTIAVLLVVCVALMALAQYSHLL